jgi:hypothetical protein
VHTEFWFESLKGKILLEDLGVDGNTTIKINPTEIRLECMNWINLI